MLAPRTRGQPGADQRVGDQREQDGQGGGARQHQGDAVQLQRRRRVAQVDVAEAGGGHDRDREVDGVDRVEVLPGEPPEDGDAGHGQAEDDRRRHPQAGVGAEQHRPGGGHPAARLLEGVALRAPAAAGGCRRRLGEAAPRPRRRGTARRCRRGGPGQRQQHPGVAGAGPADSQGPAVDLDPLASPGAAPPSTNAGTARAAESNTWQSSNSSCTPPAQLPVEHPQPHAQGRVELLGGQGGVEVADVVVLGDDQGAGRRHPGGAQHRLVPVAAADQGRAQLPGPAGQLLGRRAHHHDHVLAEPDQLLQGPVAELVQAAQDHVAAGRRGWGRPWPILGLAGRAPPVVSWACGGSTWSAMAAAPSTGTPGGP